MSTNCPKNFYENYTAFRQVNFRLLKNSKITKKTEKTEFYSLEFKTLFCLVIIKKIDLSKKFSSGGGDSDDGSEWWWRLIMVDGAGGGERVSIFDTSILIGLPVERVWSGLKVT